MAIKDIFEDTRSITEPSGALAVAGAKKWLEASGHSNKRVVAITRLVPILKPDHERASGGATYGPVG